MQQYTSTIEDYLKRINIVIEYINNHLNDDMKLETLASVSNFSPYHFHRIMKAFLGEPIGDYIARTRVEMAARLLRYSSMPIKSIAYSVGYNTPSSFTKRFKQHFGIAPLNFRNDLNYNVVKPFDVKNELKINKLRIENREATRVVYVRLIGDYLMHNYYNVWMRLLEFAEKNGCDITHPDRIAVYHDSPKITLPKNQVSDMCLVINKEVDPKGQYGIKNLSGGHYMVYSYCGPAYNLESVYDTIYGKFIPESGYELDERPMFQRYMNDPHTTAKEEWVREIFIPIIK